MQECIAAGVKEDEVGYQLAFSKQELRKCIKEYPAKELKKGLEQLYKKVEKHLCEEENLLQVRNNTTSKFISPVNLRKMQFIAISREKVSLFNVVSFMYETAIDGN